MCSLFYLKEGDKLNYILMHKDIPVVQLKLDKNTGSISRLGELYSKGHLPLGTSATDRISLNRWWTNRSIPNSRIGLKYALIVLKIPTPELLMRASYGLSLSDQYWICPEYTSIKWQEINFFTNDFSQDVGEVLFYSKKPGKSSNLMSPDNVTNGWLRKKWEIINGKRFLIKGGNQEPLNEVIASNLMRRTTSVNFVPYYLMTEGGKPYSLCENFITPNTEFITACSIFKTQKKKNHISYYQHFLNCCEALGIPNYQDSLNKMLTIDYIIANTDRHLNNFGAIRNADTLEWIGMAPIFDSGTSLWCEQSIDQIKTSKDCIPGKPFKTNHKQQIKLVTDFTWLDFKRLDSFMEESNELLASINFQRRNQICTALENQIRNLQNLTS